MQSKINATMPSALLLIAIATMFVGCNIASKSWQRKAAEVAYGSLGNETDDERRGFTCDYIRALLSLERGGEPDKRFAQGKTLLMMAVIRGDEEIVARLLSLDIYADVNRADEYGNTALIFACERGDVGIVSRLIRAGAQVNLQNKNGMTALMACAKKGNKAIAECLMAAGSDPNLKDARKRLWGDYAIHGKYPDFTIPNINSKKGEKE